jgi:UDP-N-acetylglucosamine 2-epimerase (non-hydrolysing)
MSEIHVMLVVGARPQFIKSAPLIREILAEHRQIELSIIHSGQHYDREMSEIFFHQLHIPRPLVNLQAGSGSHARQTATIMRRLEEPILKTRPDIVIVPGDTNTTLAAAVTAAKLGVPVAHLEAGLRSNDMTMPEEINRRLTDHCSSLLFAPTQTALNNLEGEHPIGSTYLTGDTMVDALRIAAPFVEREEQAILRRLGLTRQKYVLVTMHRPSNVDNLNRLRKIFFALREIGKNLDVVFLIHPRTRLRLAKLKPMKQLGKNRISLTSPQGYLETLSLLRNANCLLTDSGGMQKESFLLHVPCITVRPTTEWPETLARKANQLLPDPRMLSRAVLETAFDKSLREDIRGLKSPFGGGHASSRITRILEAAFRNR